MHLLSPAPSANQSTLNSLKLEAGINAIIVAAAFLIRMKHLGSSISLFPIDTIPKKNLFT
jgi:hypothetical protein